MTTRRWLMDAALFVGFAASAGAVVWRLGAHRAAPLGSQSATVLRAVRDLGDTEPDGHGKLVGLETARGVTQARHYVAPGAQRGVVWLPGATGEWRTPARGLYPTLAMALA